MSFVPLGPRKDLFKRSWDNDLDGSWALGSSTPGKPPECPGSTRETNCLGKPRLNNNIRGVLGKDPFGGILRKDSPHLGTIYLDLFFLVLRGDAAKTNI